MTPACWSCPTGHVLFSINDSTQVWDYAPDTTTAPAGRPTVTSVTATGPNGFILHGTQLTGFSEGAAFGDDAEMSTNYPTVALIDASGNVWYAKSFGWTPGVATGAGNDVSTQFTVPTNLLAGTYTVTVSASGVSSDPNNSVTISYGGPVYVNPGSSINQAIQTAAGLGAGVVINGSGLSGTADYDENVAVNSQVPLYIQNGGVTFGLISSSAGDPNPSGEMVLVSGGSTLTVGDAAHYVDSAEYDGVITGRGTFTYDGTYGALTLGGTDSAEGGTTVTSGTLVVAGSVNSRDGLAINGGTVQPTNSAALAGTTVTVNVPFGLDLSTVSSATLGGLAGTGDIGLGTDAATAKTLTVGADNESTTYPGVLMGTGHLSKTGLGTFEISAANAPNGGASVNGGTLTVDGSLDIPTPSNLSVGAGALLNGNGSINANVYVNGTLEAGTATATGALDVAGLSIAPSNSRNGSLAARLNGTTAGSDYDQVLAFNAVNLGTDATLNVVPGSGYTAAARRLFRRVARRIAIPHQRHLRRYAGGQGHLCRRAVLHHHLPRWPVRQGRGPDSRCRAGGQRASQRRQPAAVVCPIDHRDLFHAGNVRGRPRRRLPAAARQRPHR